MKTEALEVLKNRRSIRKYKADQIKEEELNAVVEAGTFAPNGKPFFNPIGSVRDGKPAKLPNTK